MAYIALSHGVLRQRISLTQMAHKPAHYDVAIIGAGAAGLFCASQVGRKGNSTILLDHRTKVAEKIRISGGGRCNFTNYYSGPDNFLSQNKHFAKSALAGYSPYDFISLVEKHKIAYHEKKLGQLFCDNSAQNIIDLLLTECDAAYVTKRFGTNIGAVKKSDGLFHLSTDNGAITSTKLVIATGGLSIPKIGATGFGYDIAKQFGLTIIRPRAALVPLTFTDHMKDYCAELSGLSVEADVQFDKTQFAEGLLFTHRGLSGPSILQISSYWQDGEDVLVNLAPAHDVSQRLRDEKKAAPRTDILNALSQTLPKRLAHQICDTAGLSGRLADLPDKALDSIGQLTNHWTIRPAGTEGYRTAEVTIGGVDTNELSSKTMEAKNCAGLYFIGEVVDVTGHLGGHNFQWAWASGFAMAASL